MPKDDKISMRVDPALKARYMKALAEQEFPEGITDHLTKYIQEYVKQHEAKKARKKAAASR